MPTIAELAKAIHEASTAEEARRNTNLLIYGQPKTGKTRLAGTLAKVPSVNRIYWFDGENGSDTLITMVNDKVLTPEQATKITLYKMVDTPDQAIFMDTILKCLVVGSGSTGKGYKLCVTHGRVDCPVCKTIKETSWQDFDLKKLTKNDWVVIDSGTQLGNSAMAYLCKGKDWSFKPGWDEYGPQGRILSDILSVIQAAPYCNYIVITHQLIMDEKDVEKKLIEERAAEAQYGGIFPLMGTKNFSVNCSKYFANIIYCHMMMNKHKAGSSTTYKSEVLTGSRVGMRIEDGDMDLSVVFSKLSLAPAGKAA